MCNNDREDDLFFQDENGELVPYQFRDFEKNVEIVKSLYHQGIKENNQLISPPEQQLPNMINFYNSDSESNIFFATKIFENKIYESEGQKFEDLFVAVMSRAYKDFEPVQAWGSFGDRKNDGFLENTGEYFQVYAPKEISIKPENLAKKYSEDFHKLFQSWDNLYPIKEFSFVVNDKFSGFPPQFHQTQKILKEEFPNVKFKRFDSIKLLNVFRGLELSLKNEIVGFIPNFTNGYANYDAITLVVEKIMSFKSDLRVPKLPTPDLDKKIKFNELSAECKMHLYSGQRSIGELEGFFNTRPYLKKELQQKFTELYNLAKNKFTDSNDIFFDIFNNSKPCDQRAVTESVICLMAYYFESCDIFEVPR